MSNRDDAARALDFVVERENLRRCKFLSSDAPTAADLAAERALLKVDAFAFTANNVTYAVAGDMMSYWSFFPAATGWGRVPVWGFGEVLASRHASLREGERVFGYFPMSTHLVVQAGHVGPTGFVDASPHRQSLPPVYNRYTLASGDPGYAAEHEDQQMLFWPLFMTSFVLDDFLADNDFFGARAIVLSSASSKTAFGLAYLLHRSRRAAYEVIGLTSPRNAGFCESLGCYDRVVTYDRIAEIASDAPAVFVDMAGDGEVLRTVHHHFRDRLRHSCIVGLTHWEKRAPASELPGAPPTFFFAPTQIQKRNADWGPQELQRRFADAWRAFLASAARSVRVVHGRGEAAVERVYLETLDGRARPDEGHVLSLWA